MAAFYLDEDVPEALATLLIAYGHVAVTTRAEGRKGTPDYMQLGHAALQGWVFVTLNRKDSCSCRVRGGSGESLCSIQASSSHRTFRASILRYWQLGSKHWLRNQATYSTICSTNGRDPVGTDAQCRHGRDTRGALPLYPMRSASTVARRSGRLVVIPSTPAAISLRIAAGSSTVQAKTNSPARLQAAMNVGLAR